MLEPRGLSREVIIFRDDAEEKTNRVKTKAILNVAIVNIPYHITCAIMVANRDFSCAAPIVSDWFQNGVNTIE